MKISLLIIISLIFFILVTGCTTLPAPSGSPVTSLTTTHPVVPAVPTTEPTSIITPMPTPTPSPTLTSAFPGSSGFTTLISVTGQSGTTSDTFSVPTGYWELWYTADPLTTGGQDSVSASGSNSAVFPYLSIQVMDKTNSGRIVETVEPPEDLTKPCGRNLVWIPGHGNRNSTREIKSIIL
jgi:hypothetical protein